METTVAKKEIEPRVLTQDVQRVLRRIVRPEAEDVGDSVVMLAQRADTSPRTIYRILARNTETINLHLADKCCIAAGTHLLECRLQWPDGTITEYLDDFHPRD